MYLNLKTPGNYEGAQKEYKILQIIMKHCWGLFTPLKHWGLPNK